MTDPVRTLYDTVATSYDTAFADELLGKPLDRALLTALVQGAADGPIADLGCGPGQVAAQLRSSGATRVVGVDLSPRMVSAGARRHSGLQFAAGDLRALPLADGSVAAAAAFYSIIHLDPHERRVVLREIARVLQPGAKVLVAFHIDAPGIAAGSVVRSSEFLGHAVDHVGWFLDPDDVAGDAREVGLTETARCVRAPLADVEYPSRRCYLMLTRAL